MAKKNDNHTHDGSGIDHCAVCGRSQEEVDLLISAGDVATICTGMAASMASILLAAGAKGKRSVLPHSRVMIHQPMGGAEGQASEMEITVREILKLKQELYQILCDHTGKPMEEIVKDADRDFWMTASEAVAYGMVDRIVEKNSNGKEER